MFRFLGSIMPRRTPFRYRRYPRHIILYPVRRYLRDPVFHQDLVDLLAERKITVGCVSLEVVEIWPFMNAEIRIWSHPWESDQFRSKWSSQLSRTDILLMVSKAHAKRFRSRHKETSFALYAGKHQGVQKPNQQHSTDRHRAGPSRSV